jgi:hypothetical protein
MESRCFCPPESLTPRSPKRPAARRPHGGNVEDLRHVVADEHHRYPGLAHPPNEVEDHPCLGHAQSRRGLVHNDDLASPLHCSGYCYPLALPALESAQGLGRVRDAHVQLF